VPQQKELELELDEQLSLVIANETTVKALVYLVERAGSPKEVADSLDLDTPKVSHHVKKLERLNLVELIEEREVGGAIQHIYRAVIRPIVSDREWAKLGVEERQRYSVWIVQMILADAAVSFAANLFDADPKNHLSRTPLLVDDEGLGEVSEIQNQMLAKYFDVEAISAQRRAKTGNPGIHVIAAMMCFRLPGPSWGVAGRGLSEG
jgi:predicted transcriptional regulator